MIQELGGDRFLAVLFYFAFFPLVSVLLALVLRLERVPHHGSDRARLARRLALKDVSMAMLPFLFLLILPVLLIRIDPLTAQVRVAESFSDPHMDPVQVSLFTLEQIANGVVLDFFESYDVQLTSFWFDKTDIPTATFVFLLRALGQLGLSVLFGSLLFARRLYRSSASPSLDLES